MGKQYIECPSKEATHARLASFEVVEIYSQGSTFPRYIPISNAPLYESDWPRLGIVPVKIITPQPKEPKQFECECLVSVTMPTFHDPRVIVELPKEWQEGTRVTVTIVEVPRG